MKFRYFSRRCRNTSERKPLNVRLTVPPNAHHKKAFLVAAERTGEKSVSRILRSFR